MTQLGSRSTAEQALEGHSLRGRVAVVTGASSGLGVETSRVLALAGADVIMASRNKRATEEAASMLREGLPQGSGSLRVHELDLADLDSVRAFVDAYHESARPLHLLINNAGVMATPLGRTAQGHEIQRGTNHVGHFVLTHELLPVIIASAPSRIVTLSSALHTRGRAERLFETLESDPGYLKRKYVPFDAYGDAKLANVLFARQLAKEVPEGVQSFAVHPGVIPTPLSRSMGIGGYVFRFLGRPFMKTVEQGAATTIYAATSPDLDARSGAYLADCAIAETSAEGRDAALAERLWKTTERLTEAHP